MQCLHLSEHCVFDLLCCLAVCSMWILRRCSSSSTRVWMLLTSGDLHPSTRPHRKVEHSCAHSWSAVFLFPMILTTNCFNHCFSRRTWINRLPPPSSSSFHLLLDRACSWSLRLWGVLSSYSHQVFHGWPVRLFPSTSVSIVLQHLIQSSSSLCLTCLDRLNLPFILFFFTDAAVEFIVSKHASDF